ncbi:hypothetical protein L484_007785 [Morus notabilis]|uniref:Uncharacterized protein n=1 Tax=Morus notabilis TaxID=981085 RepID=W9RMG8_9ROSA|nr:hypothetical protein L484_007785 [Morus notabilis]
MRAIEGDVTSSAVSLKLSSRTLPSIPAISFRDQRRQLYKILRREQQNRTRRFAAAINVMRTFVVVFLSLAVNVMGTLVPHRK